MVLLEIFSDNGPSFSSPKFIQFVKNYDIELNTSNPHLQCSNGMIER